MDLNQLTQGQDVETLAADAIAILEKDDVYVVVPDLESLLEDTGFDVDAHALAYRYLTQVDGSYSEEEARAIAWF